MVLAMEVFYGQDPHSGESTTTEWGQLSTTCSNATEVAQLWAHSCSDHNQLRTMALETADPIDCSHHPHHNGQYGEGEHLVHCIYQCNISGNRPCNLQHARQPLPIYAATQGIKPERSIISERLSLYRSSMAGFPNISALAYLNNISFYHDECVYIIISVFGYKNFENTEKIIWKQ